MFSNQSKMISIYIGLFFYKNVKRNLQTYKAFSIGNDFLQRYSLKGLKDPQDSFINLAGFF